MRKLFAWLGVATLAVIASPEVAHAGDPLKPYVVLVFDTSGSMDNGSSVTGFGPPSCGGNDTRLDHARCAVSRIVSSYGDMVFGLTRFRMSMSGTTTANTFPVGCNISGAGNSGSLTCNGTSGMLEVLTPLVDGNNDAANAWVNFTGNTCTASGSDPEIWNGEGNTPLAGSLVGAKDYWSGVEFATSGRCSVTTSTSCTVNGDCPGAETCVLFTLWPSNQPGFAPIANDPTKLAFLPKTGKPDTCNPNPSTCDDTAGCSSATNCCCAEQCRPYITILLTDGDETCVTFNPNVTNAASSLLSTTVENRRYRIQTKAIGFGKPAPDPEIEAIAHAGGAADGAGNEGFYVQNESDLQLAISSILDDALKTELCNEKDDDCDGAIDEDFEPAKGSSCTNGAIGQCLRTGNLVCNGSLTGLTCNAESRTCVNDQLFINGVGQGAGSCGETCNNLDDDCDGKIDENLNNCSCSPQQEQCNGRDDDCDGRIDEATTNGPPITRPCGTGTCTGIETCDVQHRVPV